MRRPLVSILIPNYNYARFLPECLDGALSQTYNDIEVILSDNNSSDGSWDIALEYEKQYRDRLLVHRFRENVGPFANSEYCKNAMRGDFYVMIGSDDCMLPSYVERCMQVFDTWPNVGFVVSHKDNIDDDGCVLAEVPFYDRSCVIPGADQAAVFMMGGMCASPQVMQRTLLERHPLLVREYQSYDVIGDWRHNFLLCLVSDMGYIAEPQLRYRIHGNADTDRSIRDMTQIAEQHLLLDQFLRLARKYGMEAVERRHPLARAKLASTCLRFSARALVSGDLEVARRYLLLAPLYDPAVIGEVRYSELVACLDLGTEAGRRRLLGPSGHNLLRREVSYPPPPGYIEV